MSNRKNTDNTEVVEVENESSNPSDNATFESVLKSRMSRRGVLGGIAVATPFVAIPSLLQGCAPGVEALSESKAASTFVTPSFEAIAANNNDGITHGADYLHDILIRWGDPLFSDAPVWDVNSQSAAAQERQFGNSELRGEASDARNPVG
jgi:secreted PhoX family phosphatase